MTDKIGGLLIENRSRFEGFLFLAFSMLFLWGSFSYWFGEESNVGRTYDVVMGFVLFFVFSVLMGLGAFTVTLRENIWEYAAGNKSIFGTRIIYFSEMEAVACGVFEFAPPLFVDQVSLAVISPCGKRVRVVIQTKKEIARLQPTIDYVTDLMADKLANRLKQGEKIQIGSSIEIVEDQFIFEGESYRLGSIVYQRQHPDIHFSYYDKHIGSIGHNEPNVLPLLRLIDCSKD